MNEWKNVLSKTIELRNPFFSSKKSAQHRHEVLLRSGCHMLRSEKVELFSKELFVISTQFSFSLKMKKSIYGIVASSNENYKLGKRLHYIRIENPLHKQSEKTCMGF